MVGAAHTRFQFAVCRVPCAAVWWALPTPNFIAGRRVVPPYIGSPADYRRG